MSDFKNENMKRIITLYLAMLLILGIMPMAQATAAEEDPFAAWGIVASENFTDGTQGTNVHGRPGWTTVGDGTISALTAQITADPTNSSNNVLQFQRTASGIFAPSTYTFGDSVEKELTDKVYISTDIYVSTWSAFEVQVQTSNGTPLLRAYVQAKAWYNNAGWKKLAPTAGEFSTGSWFTLGMMLDTTAGTYDLYLNDAVLTNGVLTKQGTGALLQTGRGIGKVRFDIDAGQSAGAMFIDNLTVRSETYEDKTGSFESWYPVKSETFSDGIQGLNVHGRPGWTTVGDGTISALTAQITADPTNSSNNVLQFQRTASGIFAPSTYTFGDSVEKELTDRVYVSTDIYVSTWSSFEIQVQTSNGTPLVRAYVQAKAWYNNAGWKKLAPTAGEFSTGAWFTLGMMLDTTAGTYDLYLNDTALTNGVLTKQGTGELLQTGRGIGKVRFDIDSGQSAGTVFIDNLTIQSEKEIEDGGGEENPNQSISGREMITQQNFDLATPESLGQSILGWNGWSLRNKPINPAMQWTLENDPGDTSGLPFAQQNQVMRARRTKIATANEWAFYTARAGSQPVEARGEVHLKFRLKQEMADNNLILRVRNNSPGDGWGHVLLSFIIRPSGQIIETTTGWNPTGSILPRQWNTVELIINTETKGYDLYINGTKATQEPIALANNGEGYDPYVSVLDLDIQKESKGDNVWYIDDLEIWTDHTPELQDIVNQLQQSLQEGDVDTNITLPRPELPPEYSIQWESSHPEVIAHNGTIEQKAYKQFASLTATIVRNADIPYVQHASASYRFDFHVTAKADATDAELLEDLKESYYTDALLTDEPLDGITADIKPIAAVGPEGVTAVLSSEDSSVDGDTGAVVRPEAGQLAKTVVLTLTLSKNETTVSKEFTLTILPKKSTTELLDGAETWLRAQSLTTENPNQLKYGLILPTEANNGVAIHWVSDKPSVIRADGRVFRGAENTPVELTATLSAEGETREQKFTFTVSLSPSVMAERDAAKLELEPEDLNNITETFAVPMSGILYNSDVVWTTDNLNVINIVDGVATVVQPQHSLGDATVKITAVVRNETATTNKAYTVIVPALPSDDALVAAAEQWLTWERISLDSVDAVKRNLALPTSYNHGVTISWVSFDNSVVGTNGQIINPSIGSLAANVRLQATITKNASSATKTFDLTVPAFVSTEELLQKAVNSLSFNSFGGQAVNAVTENLSLPKTGVGGAKISWASSNTALLSIGEDSNGNWVGFITQPRPGERDGYVTLTATLSYGTEVKTKSFVITVKPEEEWTTIYSHDYEEFGVDQLPIYAWGETVWPTETYASYRVVQDPVQPSNKAALLYRGANAINVENESWYFYRHGGYALYDGELTFSGRLFIDETLTDTLWFDLVAKNGSQICVGFYPDNTLRCQVIEGGVVYYTTKEPVVKRGQWMDFLFVMDSSLKTYHIYLDGECVTTEDQLHLNNQSVSLPWGVPYNYYQDPMRSTQMQGWRTYYLGTNSGVPSYVYLDDIRFEQKTISNAKLLEARAVLERDLLALVNPNAVTNSFVMPGLTGGSVKVNWYSSDATVLLSDGTISPGETDKKVTLTAELTLGSDTIYRPFELTIKSIYAAVDWTDEEIVAADLKNVMEQLQKSYNLSALSKNMTLPVTGKYGSTFSWSSSAPNIIAANGAVNQSDDVQTVVLTLTVQKDTATDTGQLTITVPAKRAISSSTSMTVSGTSSTGTTGIVLPPTETEKKQKFSDLPENHWGFAAVSYLVDKGIIVGVDDEHFKPERTVTRAEFAKMVVCAFDLIPTGTRVPQFTDVTEGDWYYQYVRTMAALELINGMGDASFGAYHEISRQDIAVIIYRVLKAQGFAFSGETLPSPDTDSLAEYSKEAVGQLLAAGIVSGDENGNFSGHLSATRAQAAVILYNCLRTVAGTK